MPTAQIFAKNPKFGTPIFFFLRSHADGLLRAHSTRLLLPIFNWVNKDFLRSPKYILNSYMYYMYNWRNFMLKRVRSIVVGLIDQKFKKTKKWRLEIGAVEENIKLCNTICSLEHSLVKSKSRHNVQKFVFYSIQQKIVFLSSFSLVQLYIQKKLINCRLFFSHMHSNWSKYTVKLTKLTKIGCLP